MGKFDGIRDEVVYNLEYTVAFGSDDTSRQTFFHAERDIGMNHFKLGCLGNFFYETIYIYLRKHELQRSRFNFSEVENIVD